MGRLKELRPRSYWFGGEMQSQESALTNWKRQNAWKALSKKGQLDHYRSSGQFPGLPRASTVAKSGKWFARIGAEERRCAKPKFQKEQPVAGGQNAGE